jgi:hypothetical protein
MTPAVVTRNKPRATAHVHNHIKIVPIIAQFAHPRRCHSRPEFERTDDEYPTRSKRKARVTKGMDRRSVASRTVGDRRSNRGCEERSRVVSVSTAEVEWTFCGNVKRRRPVISASARGTSEKRRKLERRRQWHIRDEALMQRLTPKFHPK